MSKTFEVLALVTKKEYIVIKAKDGHEAIESVEKDFFTEPVLLYVIVLYRKFLHILY